MKISGKENQSRILNHKKFDQLSFAAQYFIIRKIVPNIDYQTGRNYLKTPTANIMFNIMDRVMPSMTVYIEPSQLHSATTTATYTTKSASTPGFSFSFGNR